MESRITAKSRARGEGVMMSMESVKGPVLLRVDLMLMRRSTVTVEFEEFMCQPACGWGSG